MESPLNYLKHRLNDNWIIGYDNYKITAIAEELFTQIKDNKPTILLVESDPVKFIASFIAAISAECPIFLGNPHWVQQEWQQVFNLIQPDIIWGEINSIDIINYSAITYPKTYPKFSLNHFHNFNNFIAIPTGGTSGQIKFTIHTWETLLASVAGFKQYFQLSQIYSFCVLPLYHVSGLMQFIRSFITAGTIIIIPFKTLEYQENIYKSLISKPELNKFFISLVPTQLQRILQNPKLTKWLSNFATVLLGGAPAWQELLATARRDRIPLALTYGMTETASQIVTLKPDDFLAGNNSCGQILPHATLTIRNSQGEILNKNQPGIITIAAKSLALGYYPELFANSYFTTDDIGFLDNNGYLYIIGRNSNKIITGGENVFPGEIEAAILSTNLVTDVCVIGLPDRHWGQAVTAIYVPSSATVSEFILKTAIAEKLSKFKQPKYWLPVENIPRNLQGKIDNQQLQEIIDKIGRA